jgi:GMP synthase-like glutamine amidotransferase
MLAATEPPPAGGLIVLGSGAARIDPEGPLVAVLRQCVAAERPVLAIDAGAQALAMAAGGAVRAGESHEFGYVDLSPTAATAADPVLHVLGTGLPVMEWHDDAIDLPDGIPVLARCGRARVQAFRAGPRAYGLRFHPGATAETVRRWAELRGKAKNNPAIRVRIGAEIVRHQDRAERFGERLIEAWLALARGEAVTPVA